MELIVNSPAYFTIEYGVNDEVYKYSQRLYKYFKDKNYSPTLERFGICPIAAPKEMYYKGLWEQSLSVLSGGAVASAFVRMDFKKYYDASDDEKIEMIKEVILKATKKVKSRVKFDYNKFYDDLNKFDYKECM